MSEIFTDWGDEGTAEGVHAGHGVHHQHPRIVLSVAELRAGTEVTADGFHVGRGPGHEDTDGVPAMIR